jgi:hypothetical protein
LYSIDDVNDPSVKCLELLEGPLVWEARSLWFVAVGAPAFIVYRLVGLVILGLGVLVVVMMALPLVYSHPSLVTVSITGSTVKFQSTPPLGYHHPANFTKSFMGDATVTQAPLYFVNVGFPLVAAGHSLFFRGNRTVPPTHFQSFG